jgi:hypothetical protein
VLPFRLLLLSARQLVSAAGEQSTDLPQ